MRCYVTRRLGQNRCWLTRLKPTMCEVLGTKKLQVYVTPGDSLGVDLCYDAVQLILGLELAELETQMVDIPFGYLKRIDDTFYVRETHATKTESEEEA